MTQATRILHIGPRALPLALDYIDGESPASFLSRLAMANGSNLSEFALILGPRLSDVIDGSPAATACLARMGGVEPGRIARATLAHRCRRGAVTSSDPS
ncbi:MAG: hypothetical protein ACK4L4_02310 [Gemmobacter sp.]